MAGPASELSSVTSFLVIGAATLVIVKIWQSVQYLRTLKRMGIPGPTPWPLVGNTNKAFNLPPGKTMGEVFQEWTNEYGKVYGVFFPTPSIVVADLELARDVLVKKFNCFADRNEFVALTESATMRDSLLSLKGDHWKHVRSTLSPTFSSNKLKQVFPAISRVCKNFEQRLQKYADENAEVELHRMSKYVGMDVIAGVAFGMDVDSLNNPDDPFYRHGDSLITANNNRVAVLFAMPWLAKLLGKFGFSLLPRSDIDYLRAVLDAALKERSQDKKKYNDFLQLLLEAQRTSEEDVLNTQQVDDEINFETELRTAHQRAQKGLTLGEMHANSIIFLFAGYDTLTSVVAITLFTMAANPDTVRKAQEEIEDKLGDADPTYDSMMEMTYLDMCMNEAMRIHFPVFVLRTCTEDVVVGGYHVPKGLQLVVPALQFHHDPNIFENPHEFRPERHSPSEKAKRHPLSFMPFGYGPRNCIGMRLAQLEVRMIMATLLRKFTPVLSEKSVYPPRMQPLSTVTKDGVFVKLLPRN